MTRLQITRARSVVCRAGQGCQIGLFRPNVSNLASFQIGWPKKSYLTVWHHLKLVGLKKFVWPFGSFFVLYAEKFTSETKDYYSIFSATQNVFDKCYIRLTRHLCSDVTNI